MKIYQALLLEIPPLRRYARALTGDGGRADDLVQDCLERALSRLHQFQEGSNLRAWLMTILRNLNVSELRRADRRLRAAGSEAVEVAMDVRTPGQETGLAVKNMMEAMERLPLEQREVVLLIGLEDISYKDAAEVLGVPVGTVMSRLSRGRENLRRMMEGGKAGASPVMRRLK